MKTRRYDSPAAQAQQPAAPPAGPVPKVQQIPVDERGHGQRLDNFLARVLGDVPRNHIFRVIRKGEVRVNGKRAKPETRLQAGDTVRVPPVRTGAAAPPRRAPSRVVEEVVRAIVHEDPRLLVIDKPAGVAVHGGSGVSFGVIEALRAARPDEDLELVHRIDRDTSGLLLVSRKPAALRTLHALMRDGRVEKRYLALVKGKWELGAKRIELVGHGFLLGEERLAGGKPFLARHDVWRRQAVDCHDHFSSDRGTRLGAWVGRSPCRRPSTSAAKPVVAPVPAAMTTAVVKQMGHMGRLSTPAVFVMAAPPHAPRLIASLRGAVEPLIGTP